MTTHDLKREVIGMGRANCALQEIESGRYGTIRLLDQNGKPNKLFTNMDGTTGHLIAIFPDSSEIYIGEGILFFQINDDGLSVGLRPDNDYQQTDWLDRDEIHRVANQKINLVFEW
jgi:hypothetical protein